MPLRRALVSGPLVPDYTAYRASAKTLRDAEAPGARVLSYNGQRHSVRGWAQVLGCSEDVLAQRLHRGWDVERTLSTPVQPHLRAKRHKRRRRRTQG